jgi:hypothetical protein
VRWRFLRRRGCSRGGGDIAATVGVDLRTGEMIGGRVRYAGVVSLVRTVTSRALVLHVCPHVTLAESRILSATDDCDGFE